MRKRSNSTTAHYATTTRPLSSPLDSSHDDDDDNNSDPEESIQAVPPDEQVALAHSIKRNVVVPPPPSLLLSLRRCFFFFLRPILRALVDAKDDCWWSHCIIISIAAFFTYSYSATTNVQIAIMTIITLVGATKSESHLIPASIGAFVGGHNNLLLQEQQSSSSSSSSSFILISYLWVILLSWIVGLVWKFVMTRYKLLDGYAGRLGTTTFIGMNLTMIMVWGPAGVVDWNRYYYGFVRHIHIAEEDEPIPPLSTAWTWTEEVQVAILYVLSVLWLAIVAGATRIHAPKYLLGRRGGCTSSEVKLNNVLVPVLWALISILVVNATRYQHAAALYNGFAVGSYVAMAKISSVLRFAAVALVAAAWGLALTPFFVGFAGKSGFTSMLGHLTLNVMEPHLRGLLLWWSSPPLQSSSSSSSASVTSPLSQPIGNQQIPTASTAAIPPSGMSITTSNQSSSIMTPSQPQSPQQQQQQQRIKQPKQTYYTKQQRRQQQRLQHMIQSQQQQDQQLEQSQQSQQVLHHRAWSATPQTGESSWQHPHASTPV